VEQKSQGKKRSTKGRVKEELKKSEGGPGLGGGNTAQAFSRGVQTWGVCLQKRRRPIGNRSNRRKKCSLDCKGKNPNPGLELRHGKKARKESFCRRHAKKSKLARKNIGLS